MVFKFFDKNTAGGAIKSEIISNKGLGEELHNPIIREFKNRKVYSSFIENICSADLAYMQLMRKFNKEVRFLLCVTDVFGKYTWVNPLKNKTGITVTNSFQKIWVGKGR